MVRVPVGCQQRKRTPPGPRTLAQRGRSAATRMFHTSGPPYAIGPCSYVFVGFSDAAIWALDAGCYRRLLQASGHIKAPGAVLFASPSLHASVWKDNVGCSSSQSSAALRPSAYLAPRLVSGLTRAPQRWVSAAWIVAPQGTMSTWIVLC
jgi:hypothetical protein